MLIVIIGSCWSISFSSTDLHIYSQQNHQLLLLSSEYLFENIEEKFANKNLKSYKAFLKDEGMIVEEDCKRHTRKRATTDSCNKVIHVTKSR